MACEHLVTNGSKIAYRGMPLIRYLPNVRPWYQRQWSFTFASTEYCNRFTTLHFETGKNILIFRCSLSFLQFCSKNTIFISFIITCGCAIIRAFNLLDLIMRTYNIWKENALMENVRKELEKNATAGKLCYWKSSKLYNARIRKWQTG